MNYKGLKLICDGCNQNFELDKTEEIPKHINIMHCNWCPVCEDVNANCEYNEWWDEEENKPENEKIPVVPNQLNLFQ